MAIAAKPNPMNLKKYNFLNSVGLEAFIVWLIALGLYTLTTVQNFSAVSDSIQLINNIDQGELFSPHHLLYNWLAVKWVGFVVVI